MQDPNTPVTLAGPFRSRINWVQISALLGVLAVVAADPSLGVFIDMETKVRILALIAVAQSFTTAMLRTFFTGRPVTPPGDKGGNAG